MTLPSISTVLPPSTESGLEFVRRVEEAVMQAPQVQVETQHVIHGGVYYRTIRIPAGVVLTGALIKVPTTLVISGKASVLFGDGEEALVDGYMVVPTAAGRKVAYVAHKDTFLTMSFATKASTIHEAELEFTDEADRLMSRFGVNSVIVTGE